MGRRLGVFSRWASLAITEEVSMFKHFLEWLLERLGEASTWQGVTIVASAAGANLEPALATQIATVGASVFGLINIIKKG